MNDVVFTLVHGTFTRNAKWTHTNAPLVKNLFPAFGPNTVVRTCGWNGGNSHAARLQAGAGLAIFTRDFSGVFSGTVENQYLVGSNSFFGHSIKSHSSGYGSVRL